MSENKQIEKYKEELKKLEDNSVVLGRDGMPTLYILFFGWNVLFIRKIYKEIKRIMLKKKIERFTN